MRRGKIVRGQRGPAGTRETCAKKGAVRAKPKSEVHVMLGRQGGEKVTVDGRESRATPRPKGADCRGQTWAESRQIWERDRGQKWARARPPEVDGVIEYTPS